MADVADRPLEQITPMTTFSELNAAWQDHTVLAEALLPLLEERLGFWSIPDELSGKGQLCDLASHLVAEIQVPVPAAGYTDPYQGGSLGLATACALSLCCQRSADGNISAGRAALQDDAAACNVNRSSGALCTAGAQFAALRHARGKTSGNG